MVTTKIPQHWPVPSPDMPLNSIPSSGTTHDPYSFSCRELLLSWNKACVTLGQLAAVMGKKTSRRGCNARRRESGSDPCVKAAWNLENTGGTTRHLRPRASSLDPSIIHTTKFAISCPQQIISALLRVVQPRI